MADDTRETQTQSASADSISSLPHKKLPKGMILGKDGKPCRTCNSLSSFTSQTRTLSTTRLPAKDCPPDVEALGRSTWNLLHSITATYPSNPSSTEQSNIKQFMGLFGKIYPCWVCAEDFQAYMEVNRVRTESRDAFGKWMCEAHNEVNRKLGKKEFDCGKWEERWRTGWKDGSCG